MTTDTKSILDNCLVFELKKKGRDYSSLIELPTNDGCINFHIALKRLNEAGVSVDGLLGKEVGEGKWHVSEDNGAPIGSLKIGHDDLVGWIPAAIMAGGAIAGSLLGKQKQEQVPLETAEQNAARKKLMGFANTGQFGDFTAGQEVPLGYGDYNATGIEQQGLSSLQQLLSQGIPQQYQMGDAALADYLKTDPMDVSAQYDPFKATVNRQIKESDRNLKRNAGFAGNLYSTDTIRQLGDIQARGNENLTSQLANLTNESLNRRLQAIPLAYQSAESQQNAALRNVDASQQYGGLIRQLNDASIKARDSELLRRRQELQLPIEAAKTVSGQNSNYGVPSIQTSPYSELMNMVGMIGGNYLSNNMNQNQYANGRTFPSGGYTLAKPQAGLA